jgi:hypothetical protein
VTFANHPVLQALQQHILKSIPEYAIIGGLFFVAIIANMPRPEVVSSWLMAAESRWVKFKELIAILYRWVYESLQAFMAARHPPQVTTSSQTQITSATSTTPATLEQRVDSTATPLPPKETQ